jgi:transcription-repair coupling factor (superfamily II helicase)
VRTELAPFDRASVKTALIREHRRAGQSFCVVPRIEDIEPTRVELSKIVPDLSVLVAHGDMNPFEIDEAIVNFANGDGDILLATNIIENGLDVPRANTIVVFRADRFGMAQLHQLRGRVGRGRAQGLAYLLTEPGREIAPETRSRLSTLLAFDRLGSGLAISARDLDLRGAGDLVGEEQAGHMKLIGLSLYQRLLARAVDKVRGNASSTVEPQIELEFSGTLPFDYVPEPVVRLNLYSRLQRFETATEINAFAEELEDRFGRPPPEASMLIDFARLKLAALSAGISKIGAGPVAIAIEFLTPGGTSYRRLAQRPDCTRSQGRLIFKIATGPGPERLAAAHELALAAGGL